MTNLFDSAVQSIRLGIEDYQLDDPARAISAIRNFHAGVLLLAKAALIQQAPQADPKDVVGVRYKPMPDGNGGVVFEVSSSRTINLETIKERFQDFGLEIEHGRLMKLSQIRNEVEHRRSNQPHEAVREAIAKVFPVVVQLFSILKREPSKSLDSSWEVMLNVHDVYITELGSCLNSFSELEWKFDTLSEVEFVCPVCESELVKQVDSQNRDIENIACRCRACGYEFGSVEAVGKALESFFEYETYTAMYAGVPCPTHIAHACPECGHGFYLITEQEEGCVWCGFTR